MLEKISVKTTTVIFLLCCTVALALCACVNPVDIDKFLNDPIVKEAIKASKATVIIHKDSDDDIGDLVPGNGKISGLIPGKYYRLEEYDKEMAPQRRRFVKANGDHTGNLGEIGLLKDTEIINLTNFYTYKITSAKPFEFDPDNDKYYYFTFGRNSNAEEARISTDNGITTAAVVIVGSNDYYLDLSPAIDVEGNYQIMMIPNTEDWGSASRTSAYYNGSTGSTLQIGNLYRKYVVTKEIGLYQYRTALTTGNVILQGMSIIKCPAAGTPQSDFIFAQYDSNDNVTNLTFLRVEIKQIPSADDFTFDKLNQTYGNVTDVSIKPKAGKSTGDITIYYEGIEPGTTYAKSDKLPTNAGTYDVTFDVAEADGFTAISGLSAGTLIIDRATPTKDDYDIDKLIQTVGSVIPVTVTPKADSGKVTAIYYEGIEPGTTYIKSETLPRDEGIYAVTFDVAANENWYNVNGLSAGTLTILSNQAKIIINIELDWTNDPNPDADFSGSTAEYSGNNLTLKIKVTGITGKKYEWYIDDDTNPIGSDSDSNSNFTGNYSYNPAIKGDNDKWWVPGEHTITLVVDNKYSYRCKFNYSGDINEDKPILGDK